MFYSPCKCWSLFLCTLLEVEAGIFFFALETTLFKARLELILLDNQLPGCGALPVRIVSSSFLRGAGERFIPGA